MIVMPAVHNKTLKALATFLFTFAIIFRKRAPPYEDQSQGCTQLDGEKDQWTEEMKEACPGLDACPTDQAKGWYA